MKAPIKFLDCAINTFRCYRTHKCLCASCNLEPGSSGKEIKSMTKQTLFVAMRRLALVSLLIGSAALIAITLIMPYFAIEANLDSVLTTTMALGVSGTLVFLALSAIANSTKKNPSAGGYKKVRGHTESYMHDPHFHSLDRACLLDDEEMRPFRRTSRTSIFDEHGNSRWICLDENEG